MMTVTGLAHTAGDTAGLFWVSRRLLAEHAATQVGRGQYLVQLDGVSTVLLTELPDVLRFDVVVRDEVSARRVRRGIERAVDEVATGAVSALAWEVGTDESPLRSETRQTA
ncbi:hypothetical protein ACPEEZ_06255 [Frigoribacterium sp. 2-23]|uniref:hypothetical protein n=1 Tax=Frigoribacterium sp. 2-23 TaxID=3415006 RepID=UPI003C6FEAEF